MTTCPWGGLFNSLDSEFVAKKNQQDWLVCSLFGSLLTPPLGLGGDQAGAGEGVLGTAGTDAMVMDQLQQALKGALSGNQRAGILLWLGP